MLPSPRKFGKLKKPSKADILRNAIIYIENLQCLINGGTPSIKDIKSIHEQTTPQKGERIALPALELACNDSKLSTHHPESTMKDEENGTVRRSLYATQCQYTNHTEASFHPDNNLCRYPIDQVKQWLTTPNYETNSGCFSHYGTSNSNLVADLGCSALSVFGDSGTVLEETFAPLI